MQSAELQLKLENHAILPTPQRLEVAEILLQKPQHLSVEQIMDRLRGAGSRVSKATVYNTLNLFEERGLVNEIYVDPERRYFDSATHPHHHYYNVDTGELTDINDANLSLSMMPDLPEGTEHDSVEILIKVRNVQE